MGEPKLGDRCTMCGIRYREDFVCQCPQVVSDEIERLRARVAELEAESADRLVETLKARARVAELEADSWCQRLAAITLDCTVPGCDSERPTCSGHRAVAEARAALRGDGDKDGE
jgi:hypothetical protein